MLTIEHLKNKSVNNMQEHLDDKLARNTKISDERYIILENVNNRTFQKK